MYEGYKVYGPYKRSDGRKHVVLYKYGEKKITVSYPKYLMEVKLNRHLADNEEVHHKDEDFKNDKEDNLEVKTGREHRREHTKLPSYFDVACIRCGGNLKLTKEQYQDLQGNLNKGKTGPYHDFCRRVNQYI